MNVAGNDDHEESIQHVEAVTTTEAAIANTSKSKKRIASKESSAESGSAAAKVKDITMSETTRSEQASSIPDSHPPEQQANGTRTRHHNHQQCIAGSSTGPIASSAAKGSKSYNLDTSTQNQQTQPQANSKTSNDAVSENNSVSDNLPMTHSVEVVMKSVELQSPNTILRNRKAHRSTYSLSSSKQPQKHLPTEDNISNTSNSNNYSELCQHTSCNGTTQMDCAVPGVVSISVQRKPSLSSVRDHVPSAINTKPGSFKLCVEESSPAETSLKRAQLSKAKKKTGSGVGSGNGGESGGTDESNDESNDDFDWEEHKIYEVKDDAETSAKMTMVESDVCCRPLHRRIHPWIARFIKNVLVILILLVPKFILKRIHTNHHETIVLIQGGRPYMAVVIGNHLSYFVIQFLIMGLFKIIHKFGSVKVKITLETHDGLVPHIARSVWLFVLIPFWAVFVHNPTCMRAKSRLDFSASIAEGVDMHCRRWIFWWVYRCLWGIQAMNMLYILKRYTMQILSDRFEQDNSKFVELNFQGHVLDGLQKIKQHRPNRSFGQNGHHYRWAEKSTSWLASTYQVAKSPSMSRPSSSKDQKPPTASIVADTTQQRTTWDLLRKSIQRRKNNATRTEIKSATSPSDSPTDAYKDHELEPQEFVRMSKKRKSKLIDSLRNKPIENPYKKAKDLWSRICPPHRNHLERVDLEQPFKKEIMDRVWKLFDAGEGDIVTRSMFKKAIVDMVNLRKSFTSTHRTFENAMAKLNMLFNFIVFLFVIVALLIAYDVGVQQYAVGVSSLVVGGAFVTGTSAKNAFESMIFIFVIRPFDVGDRIELDGAYYLIMRIHILTTEMRRGDGMRVIWPNYVLAARHTNNLSRSDDHIDNMWMDIPLFSSARTIQRLKQKIQVFVEGEALADFQKIDVILNATNNHTKDGNSKACLQILFRVFHRCRWVDSDYLPRKLKAILFLRATLNELEQEDLNDLITVRKAIGYGNHGVQGDQGNPSQYPPSIGQQPVLNEAGKPVGFVGTSGNVYDSPLGCGASNTRIYNRANTVSIGSQSSHHQGELDAIYLAHQMSETMNLESLPINTREQILHTDSHSSTRYFQDQGQSVTQGHLQADNGFSSHNLSARHVLVPETIQLSTNAANFQPFPNGFQFQR